MKHRWIRKFSCGVGAVVAALAGLPGRAAACGGFFCSQQQGVNQAAERIIFADNGDGTITAVIQISYQGPSDHFSWLLPISTVPQGDQLAVASDLAFTRLQLATNPQYSVNTRYEGCSGSFGGGASVDVTPFAPVTESCGDNPLLAGCGSAVSVEASGVVGDFEWSVIRVTDPSADPAAPAVDWLRQNGYDVTPEGAALIGPYLADGMNLLALKLVKGADSGSIRPIVLTYPAEAPMIPIKLTAVAANQDMGVMTWALSSARAVPFNYSALELNEARINWFNASSNYNQVVSEAADAAGGQGFVTEFAGPSAQLANVIWSAPSDEQNWQSVRGGTYRSFNDLFNALSGYYGGYSGFWEGVRQAVTLPDGLSFSDFKSCPYCYADKIEFSPTRLFDAVEASTIEPMRIVQRLFDRAPYTTRLYSTLSPAEMTVDPVFVFNPDLPDVSNVHTATRVIECGKGGADYQAPWRIELPQGSVLRGTAASVGTWPAEVAAQPANLRVSLLSRSGAGRVIDDNGDEINSELAAYNDSLASSPQPYGSSYKDHGGDFCSLSGSPGSSGLPGGGRMPLAVTLSSLLGAVWLRRRRRST